MSDKENDKIELKEAPNVPMQWCQVIVYKETTQNREVIEFSNLNAGVSRYKGGIIIAVQRQTPQGIVSQPFRHEFDFPADWTREQCFENFDSEGQKAATLWQQKQYEAAMAARQNVVGAKAMPPGQPILGTNGKPMQANRQQRRRR